MKEILQKPKPFLSLADRRIIKEMIGFTELKTSGEIKVCVVEKSCCESNEQDIAQAVQETAMLKFQELGIGETRDGTGIIILISPEDSHVVVYGDDPINKVINDGWPQVVDFIIKGVLDGEVVNGITKAIERIGERLSEHFPVREGNTNELSDDVIIY